MVDYTKIREEPIEYWTQEEFTSFYAWLQQNYSTFSSKLGKLDSLEKNKALRHAAILFKSNMLFSHSDIGFDELHVTPGYDRDLQDFWAYYTDIKPRHAEALMDAYPLLRMHNKDAYDAKIRARKVRLLRKHKAGESISFLSKENWTWQKNRRRLIWTGAIAATTGVVVFAASYGRQFVQNAAEVTCQIRHSSDPDLCLPKHLDSKVTITSPEELRDLRLPGGRAAQPGEINTTNMKPDATPEDIARNKEKLAKLMRSKDPVSISMDDLAGASRSNPITVRMIRTTSALETAADDSKKLFPPLPLDSDVKVVGIDRAAHKVEVLTPTREGEKVGYLPIDAVGRAPSAPAPAAPSQVAPPGPRPR